MTDKEIARARVLFERIDNGLMQKREGSGLGLPVSIELIEAHGGRIDLSSEKGVGTEAIVFFPARRVVDAGAPGRRDCDAECATETAPLERAAQPAAAAFRSPA